MNERSPFSQPGRITGTYVIVGVVWAAFTVLVIGGLSPSTRNSVVLDLIADLGFIAVTATLLHIVLRGEYSRRRAVEAVRDQTREALVETSSRYDSLETISPVGIYHADRRGNQNAFNRRWSEITGLSTADAMGDGWTCAIHPDDRARVVEEWHAAVTSNQPFNSEYRIHRPDGAVLWVISQAIPRNDPDSMTGYLGVLTDVTPRKEAEEALKRAARDYQLLFDRNPLPVWIYDLQTLRFLAVNDSAVELYGYSRDEFLSMTITDLRPEAEVPEMLEALSGPCDGKFVSAPGTHVLKNGAHIIVQVTAVQLDYQDRPACMIAVHDVTEQLRAEQTLRDQAGLLEATSDAVISTDNHLRIQTWNAGAERIYGWKSQEVVGRPMVDIVAAMGLPDREHYVRDLQTTGAWKGDFRHRRKDGSTFVASGSVAAIHDRRGNATGYVIINRDVTEFRRADAELRQRNRELEALLTVSSALSGRFDLDLMLDSITHVTRDLLPGADRTSLWLSDSKRGQIVLRAASGFGTAIETGTAIRPNGSLIGQVFRTRQAVSVADTSQSDQFRPSGNPELDLVRSVIGVPLIAEGQVIGCLFAESVTNTHAFTDDAARLLMTLAGHAALAILDAQLHKQMQSELVERLRAEEAMRASEELHRLAFKATPKVAIWDWDINTNVIRWSEGISTVYGYGPETTEVRMDDWQNNIHPDDRDRLFASVRTVVEGAGQNWGTEYRFRRGDGTYAFVSVRGFVVRDAAGRAIRMIGSMVDITDQKASEEALRQSEKRFRRIAESAPDMIFRWTFRNGFEYVSPAARDISGYSPEEFYMHPEMLHRLVHPEDQDTLDAVFDAAQTGTATRTEAQRWTNKDGELVHIELRYTPLYDDQGDMFGVEGIAHDVTQHILARSRLRELGQRLAATQDRERKQVALELHDDLGQKLTVAKMRLRLALNSLPKDSHDLHSRLATLTMLIDESLQSVRSMSHELHPPLLVEMGWQAALEGLCESLSKRSGLPIVFKNTGRVVRLPSDTEITIYRMSQEAITNALRHGEASQIRVSIRVSQRTITIQIEDDGQGFDVEQIRLARQPGIGLGLLSMQERADAIGASLTVTSQPGHGTKVVLRLPRSVKGSDT